MKALFGIANRIEQHLAVGTKQTEQIAQSLLAKAFAGALVENEADLARREGRAYEPAAILLERIAAERAAAQNGKSKRQKASGVRKNRKSKKAI